MLAEYPYLLFGGASNDEAGDQLEAFWTCYKFVHPEHEAFKKPMNHLRSTLPLAVHGDEGRYLKKGNFMVCTIETLLGNHGPKKDGGESCTCHLDGILARYGNIGQGRTGDASFQALLEKASHQQVNDSGNEFLTKFLLFGMSSLVYKLDKGILHKAFKLVSDDMRALHEHGITVRGYTWFASTLGVKGDMKFHHQLGNLSRSYYNAGTKQEHPMCSHCLAGSPNVLFEDLSDTANWQNTVFVERPWREGCMPELATIPFDPAPEKIFRLDLFHCWKCGLGRDLTGSGVIILSQLGYWDYGDGAERNLPARLQRAHSTFVLWCRANNKSPALHSFSKSLLNYKNAKSFAWFNVKGSDNTLITSWLLFTVKLAVQSHGHKHRALEEALIETLQSAVVVFKILHTHPLWLHRTCAQRAQHHLTVTLRGYKVLAKVSQDLSVVGFGLKPKLHACDHVQRDLRAQIIAGAPRVLNPMCWSCEANESIVGHVSRISRRVNSRTVSTRVLDRICIKVKNLAKKFKQRLRHERTNGANAKR